MRKKVTITTDYNNYNKNNKKVTKNLFTYLKWSMFKEI